MGEDLVPEKMREENQDGESLDNISLKNFEDRWWNRLLQTGLLGPDGGKLTTEKTESVSETWLFFFEKYMFCIPLKPTQWDFNMPDGRSTAKPVL